MVDFLPFLHRNRLSVCWPRVTKFLGEIREDKDIALPVGIAGFCWGGLHAIKLSHNLPETKTESGRHLADVFFAAHPSNVTIPQDIIDVKSNLSIAIGDDDGVLGIQQVQEAKAILQANTDIDSEVIIYPGAKHGFSIRASRAVPDSKETQQAEDAEKQAIAWFQRHFELLGPAASQQPL
jgi:dienelactone hydrolase